MLPLTQIELLNTRICDLGLQINTSRHLQRTNKLHRELQARGIKKLNPKIYLGDEWFCPDRTIAISIPFYLESDALTAMQHRNVGNVEGETKREFMRLLRHECGHAFDHAYQISFRTDFISLFGNPKTKYQPHNYAYLANSRDFVSNLGECYAQSHPTEDFAETFAVWLNPHINWKKQYKQKPIALKKLEFVDKAASQFGLTTPIAKRGPPMGDARKLKSKLARYYLAQKNQQSIQNFH